MRQHFLTLTQMKIKELHTQGLVISSRLETCYLYAPHHYLPPLSHPPHTRCCGNGSSSSRYLVINGVNFAPDKKRGAHFTVHYFKASVETKAQCLLHWKWALKYSSYKGSNRPTAQPRGRKARMYACAQDWNAQRWPRGAEDNRKADRWSSERMSNVYYVNTLVKRAQAFLFIVLQQIRIKLKQDVFHLSGSHDLLYSVILMLTHLRS